MDTTVKSGRPISPGPNLKHPLGFSSNIITVEKPADPEQILPSWDLHKLFLLIHKSNYTLFNFRSCLPRDVLLSEIA